MEMKLKDFCITLPISMPFLFICKIIYIKQLPCAANKVILGERVAVPDIHIQLAQTLDEGEDEFLLEGGVLSPI